jgi:hypothetical protein
VWLTRSGAASPSAFNLTVLVTSNVRGAMIPTNVNTSKPCRVAGARPRRLPAHTLARGSAL